MSTTLKVKLMDPDAQIPKQMREGDAGYDLYSLDKVKLQYNKVNIIRTGIAIEIPPGYVGLIRDRSGLAIKFGITTRAGVIDSTYRGEIMVAIVVEVLEIYPQHFLEKGDRIAQLVIVPYLSLPVERVSELPESIRGDQGFGSSGK